ncbi:MAG: recombinase family protein [Candidatus Pelethousia sp.]|nr:recombinase family protein [Candidatus Pelethousia sp.]
MPHYAMYLRKSRADAEAEARGEGETLAKHRAILTELAKKQGIEIGEIYQEIVSGESLSARPEARRLLRDILEGKWEGVLVMEIERLARGDTIDQGQVARAFKWSGAKIVTPLKVYDPDNEFDEEYFEFSLFMSRREYKTIRRRMQAGRVAAVKEGKYIGSVAPYGYRRIHTPDGYTLETDPNEAPVVRNIFDWYMNGVMQSDGTIRRLGVALITRRLNETGAPTRKGGVWVVATVQGILRNPVYMGKIRWDQRKCQKELKDGQAVTTRPRAPIDEQIIVDGMHEPIIPEKLFLDTQRSLDGNKPAPVPRNSTMKNPLSGLVVCGKCGRKMVRRPYSTGQGPSLLCSCNACDNVSAELSLVETRVLDAMRDWVEKYAVNAESRQAPVSDQAERAALASIEEQIQQCEQQQGRLHDLLERGVYTDEVFFSRSSALKARMTSLQAEHALAQAALHQRQFQNDMISGFIPKWQAVLDDYPSASSPKEKNDLLKTVLKKIAYTRESGGRWSERHDNFSVVLYPLLPTHDD